MNIHTSNATRNILKSCLNIKIQTTKKSIHFIILRFFYVTMMHIRFELLVVSMDSVVALFKLFKFAKQFTTIVRREKLLSHYMFQTFPSCGLVINVFLTLHTPPH